MIFSASWQQLYSEMPLPRERGGCMMLAWSVQNSGQQHASTSRAASASSAPPPPPPPRSFEGFGGGFGGFGPLHVAVHSQARAMHLASISWLDMLDALLITFMATALAMEALHCITPVRLHIGPSWSFSS